MKATDRQMEKIRKLLAMANQDKSLNEAEIALRQANKLMEKYGLTLADVEASKPSDVCKVDITDISMSGNYAKGLFAAVANLFDCVALASSSGKHATYSFNGLGSDPEVALSIFTYLMETLEREVTSLRKTKELVGRSAINSYRVGFVVAITNTIQEMINDKLSATVESKSLVVQKKSIVEESLGDIRSRQTRTSNSDPDAYHRGRADGSKVNVNRQIA